MFNKEIKALKKQIKEKTISREAKKLEIQEIEEREKLIKEFEQAETSKKSGFKRLLTGAGIPVIVTLVLLITRKISFIEALNYIVLGEVATAFVWSDGLTDYNGAKKSMRKITHIEYQKAKQREKKDKELKMSLSKECLQIEQDLLKLNEQINSIKKSAAMQKLGYHLEQLLSIFKLDRLNLTDEQKKVFCDELFEQYLENQYYNHVYFDNPEIDTNQTLGKKYDSLK